MLDYLSEVSQDNSLDDIRAEPWFDPSDTVPVAQAADLCQSVESLKESSVASGVRWGPIRSVVIPAPRFNRLLDEWRVKSGVLATAVIRLLQGTLDLPGDDPLFIAVDRLGGRQFYAPLLNEAFSGSWVRVLREGPACCEYAIDGMRRQVHLRFEPRADGAHLNVALASMAAKYGRELCMRQFNRYWLRKKPGLKPTAGYPLDAERFYKEIKPIISAEGLEDRAIWRVR